MRTVDGCETGGTKDEDGGWESMRVLCYFVYSHGNFWLAEVEAQLEVEGVRTENFQWERVPGMEAIYAPFMDLVISLKGWARSVEEVVRSALSRCTLVRAAIDEWGRARRGDFESLERDFKRNEAKARPFLDDAKSTFRFNVEAFGEKINRPEQKNKLDQVAFAEPKGKADLSDPEKIFWLVEMPEFIEKGGLQLGGQTIGTTFLGREICRGTREPMNRLSVPKRPFAGPTAMEAEMSAIMCNIAKSERGSFSLDPFVGSGGVLLAASLKGSHTMGFDIDLRALRRAFGDTLASTWSNFRTLDLSPPLSLVRLDMANRPIRERAFESLFDSVLTDPPYGLRAGGRKTGHPGERNFINRAGRNNKKAGGVSKEEDLALTAPYGLAESLADLVDLASMCLRINGRLVFFCPGVKGGKDEVASALPSHPAMRRVAMCEQPLSGRRSRYLIAMRKERETDCHERQAAYERNLLVPLSEVQAPAYYEDST